MPEIVKVQLAVGGARVAEDRALVYAKGRVRVVEQPIPGPVGTALRAGFPKGFFEAQWDKDHWIVGKRVAEQDW